MERGDFIDAALIILAFGLGVAIWWAFNLRDEAVEEREEGFYKGLRGKLRHAGIVQASAPWFFWVMKVLLAFLLALIVQEWTPSPIPMVIAALVGFFIPDVWLRSKIRKRQRRIRRSLSFYLDLVNSLLRSGMTLERAFIVAAKQGFRDPHPLADEIGLLSRELELGRDRIKAFKMLADRTGVMELRVMSAAVQVGLRSGASIEDTLEIQADLLRFRQQQEAIGRLNRSMAISVAPVFLVGVPLWLVLVFYPAVIDLVQMLRGLGKL